VVDLPLPRRCPRRAEHREGIGDFELPGAEPEDRCWPAAVPSGGRRLAGGFDLASPDEHPLQIGRGDAVAERSLIVVPQFREGERGGNERKAQVGVGQLGSKSTSC